MLELCRLGLAGLQRQLGLNHLIFQFDLFAFETGELCPAGWKPGQKTLGKA